MDWVEIDLIRTFALRKLQYFLSYSIWL